MLGASVGAFVGALVGWPGITVGFSVGSGVGCATEIGAAVLDGLGVGSMRTSATFPLAKIFCSAPFSISHSTVSAYRFLNTGIGGGPNASEKTGQKHSCFCTCCPLRVARCR